MASTGREGPEWYLAEPERGLGDDFYLTAFHRLSTNRSISQGAIGPIPDWTVANYAERKGLTESMQEVFETVIYRMDDAYMRNEQNKQQSRHAASQREAARNSGKTKIR